MEVANEAAAEDRVLSRDRDRFEEAGEEGTASGEDMVSPPLPAAFRRRARSFCSLKVWQRASVGDVKYKWCINSFCFF
jgi:hypothetical protein